MKKLLTVLLALAMAFTMVFATAASAEDGYKDSITWVIGNDQDILDPQNNVSNSKVIPQYYDGLLGYDNDGNVVCKMAESYEASEDKMTWTFHLRQDVYFHSGRHCTAHDFEATFDRLLNTENPQRYTSNASSFIDTAVATDDYTFVITLKEPKAFFLQAIAKHWAFVLNPEYIEKYGADLGKTAESVDGTGPFKCTQWDKGEVMKFEAFENYYEGAPLTHEIVMKIVPEQTSRAIAVETAQADIADGISPDDAVRLDALDGVTVRYVLLERFDDYAAYGDSEQPIDGLWGYKHAYTKTLKYWIVKDAATRFNGLMSGEYDFIVKATDAYLGTLRSMPDITCYSMQTGMINLVWNKHSTDKYLRLAFQALANADDLNTANYGSLYDNDPCFMEKSQPGWYTTKGEEFFCQNDPEKAKELLAQSSFDTSKPLRILTATGGGAEAMLEVLRQEAAKIGVTLEITATDRTTMTSMRNDETLYDAYFTTFSSVAVPSLRNFLSADYAGWSDDEHLQELMLQMTTAATKEAAFATWEEIQYYCYSDYCPILMMGHFHQAAACTNRLTGYNVFLTTNFWNAKLAK